MKKTDIEEENRAGYYIKQIHKSVFLHQIKTAVFVTPEDNIRAHSIILSIKLWNTTCYSVEKISI